MPTSLWFTSADHHDDEHGYVCCSTCITDFTKMSGIPINKWIRMHTPAQWMRYPEETWKFSLHRSFRLKNDATYGKPTKASKGAVAKGSKGAVAKGSKGAGAKSSKRKRTPKSGEVVLEGHAWPRGSARPSRMRSLRLFKGF